MKILLRIISAILVALALLVVFVSPLFATGPSGTSVIVSGALIDAAAVCVIALGVWTWRRASRLRS